MRAIDDDKRPPPGIDRGKEVGNRHGFDRNDVIAGQQVRYAADFQTRALLERPRDNCG